LLSDPKCERAVSTILQNAKHPAFASMWRTVAERGYGKPKEDGEPPRRTMRFIFCHEDKNEVASINE
jgi:hypothetical protein